MDRLLPVASRSGARAAVTTTPMCALRPRLQPRAGVPLAFTTATTMRPARAGPAATGLPRHMWTWSRSKKPTQPVYAYRIHEKPRRLLARLRYALAVTTASLAAIVVYNTLVLDRLSDTVTSWLQQLPPDVLKALLEGEEDDDDSYIPIPFTLRQLPAERSTMDDPVFATYSRIMSDKALATKVYDDVKKAVRDVIAHKFGPMLGTPLRYQSMLSIDWEAPLPWGQFWQKGLVWEEDEDGNSIGPRIYDFPLPFDVGRAMYHTIYPWHIYASVKAYLLAFVKGDLTSLKNRFIIVDPDQLSPSSSSAAHGPPTLTAFPAARSQNTPTTTTTPMHPSSPSNPSIAPPHSSSPSTTPAPNISERSSAMVPPLVPSQQQRIEQAVGPTVAAMHRRGAAARQAFRHEFNRTRPSAAMKDLTGCLLVSGQFHYIFDRGVVTVWVYTYWDPEKEAVSCVLMERKRLTVGLRPLKKVPPKPAPPAESS